jgi:hypothetical protein
LRRSTLPTIESIALAEAQRRRQPRERRRASRKSS